MINPQNLDPEFSALLKDGCSCSLKDWKSCNYELLNCEYCEQEYCTARKKCPNCEKISLNQITE